MKASETTAMPTKEQIVAVIDTTAVVCDGPFDGVVIDNTEEVADAILALFSRSPVKAPEKLAWYGLPEHEHLTWDNCPHEHQGCLDCGAPAPVKDAAPAPVLTEEERDFVEDVRSYSRPGLERSRLIAIIDRLTKQAPQPEEKV